MLCSALIGVIFSACFTPRAIEGNQSGNLAPNIRLSDADGVQHALKDLCGKMVVVEFWEANNAESRRNHFTLQQLFNKYKDVAFNAGDGLAVFSVSIDVDAAIWKQAIKEDGLTFQAMVNDPAGWMAESIADYQVSSLPKYFLINEKGIIIQNQLAIPDLERILEENK